MTDLINRLDRLDVNDNDEFTWKGLMPSGLDSAQDVVEYFASQLGVELNSAQLDLLVTYLESVDQTPNDDSDESVFRVGWQMDDTEYLQLKIPGLISILMQQPDAHLQ